MAPWIMTIGRCCMLCSVQLPRCMELQGLETIEDAAALLESRLQKLSELEAIHHQQPGGAG